MCVCVYVSMRVCSSKLQEAPLSIPTSQLFFSRPSARIRSHFAPSSSQIAPDYDSVYHPTHGLRRLGSRLMERWDKGWERAKACISVWACTQCRLSTLRTALRIGSTRYEDASTGTSVRNKRCVIRKGKNSRHHCNLRVIYCFLFWTGEKWPGLSKRCTVWHDHGHRQLWWLWRLSGPACFRQSQ